MSESGNVSMSECGNAVPGRSRFKMPMSVAGVLLGLP
jgi:hypothetical protein